MPRAVKPKHWVLLNPGPVNVSEKVRRALLGPDVCHREKEFFTVLRSVRERLLRIFKVQKTHKVAVLTGSGTLAVEAMLSSYGAARKKVLVLSNGVYGERMLEILKVHGVPHSVLRAPLGSFPNLASVEAALKKDKRITAVALVHHETSTGMLNPLASVQRLVKKYGKVLLVDAVSSLGAETLDLAGIDFCAASSGKCLHAFPGLSFVFISKRGLGEIRGKNKNSVYFDLQTTLAAQESDNTPFTPAVQLFYAFEEALKELEKEGLSKRIQSYAEKSRFLEEGLSALGVRFLVQKKHRSHVLTALWLPKNVSYEKLHGGLKKKGFVIYSGQSELKKKIFRLSNLGEVSLHDLARLLKEMKAVLPANPAQKIVPIVLAAGVGKRFGKTTKMLPKCLIPIGNENLLSRYLDTFREVGFKKIVIVVGHLKHKIIAECRKKGHGLKIRFITNRKYRQGSLVSLFKASRELGQNVIIMDADVYFPVQALAKLVDSPLESAFLLDPRSKSTGEEMMLMTKQGRPWSIAKKTDPKLKIIGEATGIVKFSKIDALFLRGILKRFVRKGVVNVEYEEAYSVLMKKRKPGIVSVGDIFWSEMDFPEDLARIVDANTTY